MALMLVASQAMPSRALDIAALDLGLAVLTLAVFHVVVLRKLEALALPSAYVKAWLLSRALTLAGYVFLFVSLGYSSLEPR